MKNKIVVSLLTILTIWALVFSSAFPCELMGFSFNEKVPANHLLSAFRYRSKRNPDGWGVAFYPDKSVQLFKEPKPAMESKLVKFLTDYESLKTRILVAHVRKAAVGGPLYENTHPFQRELNGKEYVLAHNGVLKQFHEKLELGRIKPLGINDTEFLLCFILGRIDTKDIEKWNESTFVWLHELFLEINDLGTLNVLFSDGEYLFAYHDENSYSSLHYIVRKPPYANVHLRDLQKVIHLSKIYPRSANGIVIATNPLTDEKWKSFTPGQLIVLKDGKSVFSRITNATEQ